MTPDSEREMRAGGRSNAPEEPDSGRIADRLERLTADESERVLRRAIELDSHRARSADASMDANTLLRVAAELGIDRATVHRAIADVLAHGASPPPSALDRLLVPGRMTVRRVAPAALPAVVDAVERWMTTQEAMRRRSGMGTSTVWERDGGPLASMRTKLGLGLGSGALRSVGLIRADLGRLDEATTVVSLEADTSAGRTAGLTLLGVAAAVGATAGTLTAGLADAPGIVDAAAGIGTFAVLGGSVWLGIRLWAGRIRAGLERAAEAVSEPALVAALPTAADRIRSWIGRMFGRSD